ncbi:MAG: MBL fold metallo-hydrolase [Candidatus Bipolaricaulia bacterium]
MSHSDHWDKTAIEILSKDLLVLCQPEGADRIREGGFASVQPVASEFQWRGIHFVRTGGMHGTGEIGRRLGPVSGFILRAEGAPCLYITGDTIWCSDVDRAILQYQPDVIVVNAGAAQFLEGDPITMTAEDVIQVCKTAPNAQVIAVHMEAINHCLLTRKELGERLEQAGLLDKVQIPMGGTLIQL